MKRISTPVLRFGRVRETVQSLKMTHYCVLMLMSLVLLLPLSSFNCFAVTNPQAADPIPAIRQQYAAINKRAPRLRKVKKELSGFSAEGGELVAYFDGKAIMKMVATYYGETGRTVEEFYYRDEKLIFAFRKVLNYDRPLSGKVVSRSEERFYFNNDQLIRWIDPDKKQVEASNPDYAAKQAEYLDFAGHFLSAARSKTRTLEAWN